jgi:predicted O-methyltransferase YrrM
VGSERAPGIVWTSEDTFELAGTEYICDKFGLRIGTEPDRFCLAKIRPLVDRYVELFATLAPSTIVEVGILEGASTALFADLARPSKLVAIDRREPSAKLQAFITRRGLADTVAVYGGVDQGDAARLGAIVDDELGDRPIDLVVDDASHLLDPTRRTFNCLFPRLRPGGIYLLEDWATGLKADGPAPQGHGDEMLVNVVFEMIAAKGRHPTLFGDVTVRGGWVVVERGRGEIDEPFDIAARAASGT